MNIAEILKSNPELAGSLEIKVNASDLQDFAEMLITKGRQAQPTTPQEQYMTPAEFSEALSVSLVTLWNWDKKGITQPLRIGNAKRYRRSDLEKILSND